MKLVGFRPPGTGFSQLLVLAKKLGKLNFWDGVGTDVNSKTESVLPLDWGSLAKQKTGSVPRKDRGFHFRSASSDISNRKLTNSCEIWTLDENLAFLLFYKLLFTELGNFCF